MLVPANGRRIWLKYKNPEILLCDVNCRQHIYQPVSSCAPIPYYMLIVHSIYGILFLQLVFKKQTYKQTYKLL